MKIGVVGIGDICRKAYLPVLAAQRGIELFLCTRNRQTLAEVSERYRIARATNSLDELVQSGIDAAFVHTTTNSHPEVVRHLLEHNVHVYVDKPIAYHYQDTEALADLSFRKKRILMTGFNRRYAPLVRRLRDSGVPDIVIIQKNRVSLPGLPRQFILDDFIHVVDTLRYLARHNQPDFTVKYRMEEGKLHSIILQLTGTSVTAIGIMNRDSGMSEEVIEFMTPGNKYIVRDLVSISHQTGNSETAEKSDDWEPTLRKRGFYDIVEQFLSYVKKGEDTSADTRDALITHRICEDLVEAVASNTGQ
ncbi:MAG: Gfo/Idh/MocA family oxidoreductase [Bacteroidota bacterium]|jgi:virulence factor|nr:MAG: gfo/Idh/MocA family oxidoreductase [Bacteroidota bacterium]